MILIAKDGGNTPDFTRLGKSVLPACDIPGPIRGRRAPATVGLQFEFSTGRVNRIAQDLRQDNLMELDKTCSSMLFDAYTDEEFPVSMSSMFGFYKSVQMRRLTVSNIRLIRP